MSVPDGFAATYGVELLCEREPDVDKAALLAALRRRCPGAVPLDGNPREGLLAFHHPDHPIAYADGTLPAQTLITPENGPLEVEGFQAAIEQSWRFPEAECAVRNCSASVLVTDFMARGLEYRERLTLFQKALAATLEVVPCRAIHWQPTQQIVDPRRYLEAFEASDRERFFEGALNVRFFTITGTDGDMLMDTLGLAALGLPDLQCQFRLIEPDAVAPVLYTTGFYLYERGDVIEDGHTVAGIEPGSKWRCQHESSLVAPEREVLDINPGLPFAAGKRG